MATYENEILGAPVGVNTGKDIVTFLSQTGTIDIYQETLVGGVDYVLAAFGASNGQTMLDPAILIFNSAGNLVGGQLDSGVLGGRDPFFTYRTSGFIGQAETYFIGVFDQAGRGGRYTLSVEGAGPPVFFGS